VWTVTAAALVVAVLLMTACAPTPGEGPPLAPPQGLTAYGVVLPQPPVTSGPAAPRTADQIGVVLEGLDAATNNRWGWLRAMSRSDVACTLEGSPSLLVEQGGRQLDLLVEHEPCLERVPPCVGLVPCLAATWRSSAPRGRSWCATRAGWRPSRPATPSPSRWPSASSSARGPRPGRGTWGRAV